MAIQQWFLTELNAYLDKFLQWSVPDTANKFATAFAKGYEAHIHSAVKTGSLGFDEQDLVAYYIDKKFVIPITKKNHPLDGKQLVFVMSYNSYDLLASTVGASSDLRYPFDKLFHTANIPTVEHDETGRLRYMPLGYGCDEITVDRQ